MYRTFNENVGMNCKARIAQGIGHMVQNSRVYWDHTIVFEEKNRALIMAFGVKQFYIA